jgi:HAD superfamily hydrolase (TIGR01459 family)
MRIESLVDIQEKYDVFFVDIWGVVHDGYNPYPGTVNKLNELIKRKKVVFISNAPRPYPVIASKLKEFNIIVEDAEIVSSGDITREELKKLAAQEKKIYHIGAARNSDILKDIDISIVDNIKEADFVLLTAYLDEGENLEQFDDLFKEAISLSKPFICANPDTIVIHGNSHRYCAGYFASKVEELGGKVLYYGKPHNNIYEYALRRLNKDNLNYSKILMIGDTFDTDIMGANKLGIHSALVATGNTEILLQNNNVSAPERLNFLRKTIEEKNIYPTWIIHGLF